MKKGAKAKTEGHSPALVDVDCPHSFGYLSQRPRSEEIPVECLTCKKLLDCMLYEVKEDVEHEEHAIKNIQEPAGAPFEEIFKGEREEAEEHKSLVEGVVVEPSEDYFIVENLGMLYAYWSKTVRIPREALLTWGEKVEEVEVETALGKRARFKVQPMEESQKRVVQIPDQAQRDLGIASGDLVKVEPVINPQKGQFKSLKNLFSRK
jgi:translation initiation factor IF-1